ncbi:MAG: SpoIID/LytB domain-containing protein [Clostridiales bacterium]|nr:SpoIID/LytB domain-containing protein [Clostridiales bacterium]
MQIKLKKYQIKKTPAVIAAIFALALMIKGANLFTSQPNGTDGYSRDAAAKSIYLSLEEYEVKNGNLTENGNKMNNQKEKNSNIENNGTSFADCAFVRVLDAQSGEIKEEDIEYYTLCVLLAEMPQSYETQALMAQAVACRTYACRNIFYPKHDNADVCTDYKCCQSYREADGIKTDISKALFAVNATKGIIASYGGEPILAAYHASSYKKTKSCDEVWGGRKDYLVSVYAPESKEDCAYTVTVSFDKTNEILMKKGKKEIEFITADDGLCAGAKCEDGFLDCKTLKNMFSLRSDAFEVEKTDIGYDFTCYGYGHGVGMSQKGANLLAKQGFDYCEILKYYYSGIKFDFII